MKRKLSIVALAAVCAFTISACQAGSSKSSGGKAGYDASVAAANSAIAKAKSVDGLWRDTGKLMKGAGKAAKAGDYAKATKMVKIAEFQANTGVAQADSQKNVGTPSWMN